MSDPIRRVMTLLDENKADIPEGVYLEMCNNLKTVYATGDAARDTYLLNLTNDYLEALETIEPLRHELINTKRDVLRARVSRFEHISLPILNNRDIIHSVARNETQHTMRNSRMNENPPPAAIHVNFDGDENVNAYAPVGDSAQTGPFNNYTLRYGIRRE